MDLSWGETSRTITETELWTLIVRFIAYLCAHKRGLNEESLTQSVHRSEKVYNQILKSMLGHMARHGYPDAFPEDGSIFNRTSGPGCSYTSFSREESKLISDTSFWLEGVCQTIIGIAGIVGNITAISIYWTSVNKFYTIFYRLLIGLLFVHTVYIVLQITVYFGRYHGSSLFHIVFASALYPLPSMMLHSSTFLTVLLAWHRFSAAVKPVEYFIKWKFINPTGTWSPNSKHEGSSALNLVQPNLT